MDAGAGTSKAEAAAGAAAAPAAPRSRPSLRVVTRSSSGGGGGGKAGNSDDDDEFHEFSNATLAGGASPSPRLGGSSGGRGTPRTPPPGPGLAAALSVGIEAGGDGLTKRGGEGGEKKKKNGSGGETSSPKDPSPAAPLASQQQQQQPLPEAAPASSSSSNPGAAAAGPPPPSPGDALFRVKDLDTGRELKVRTVSFSHSDLRRALKREGDLDLDLLSFFSLSKPPRGTQKKTLRNNNRGTPSET